MPQVLMLCYHAVSPTWEATLSVAPDTLERQLHWLVSHGWQGVTFRDALREPPVRKTLVVSFDDGFTSVAKVAHPILTSLGLTATVFVPTDYISGERTHGWGGIDQWEQTPDAKELSWMGWSDLGVLADAGWEIGSHTRSHPHLTRLDDRAVRAELEESRETIEANLGTVCETVAYPYGDVDERVAEHARLAGYLGGAALPETREPEGRYRCPRVGIYHGDSWWRFRLKLNPALRRAAQLPIRPRGAAGSPTA